VRNDDSLSSLVWLLVGLGFIAGGVKMGIGPLNAPGPGFFPTVIGGIFSLLSVALFITASSKKNPIPDQGSFWKEKKNWKKVSLALFSLIFYLIFLNYLGYILTTFLFLLSLLKFVGKRRWGSSILTAIVVSLGSYVIFKVGLGVSLPKGLVKF
jgi:putative tricarboxylic transport membrane protein